MTVPGRAPAATLIGSLAARCTGDWAQRLAPAEREAMRAIVRIAFLDTAGCVLAGRDEPVTGTVLAWARGRAGGGREGTVLFTSERLPAPLASLVNAVSGHALDFDDVGLAGHPSVVLVPVLLAEHDRSRVSGFALVQAYAKGYATWGALQRRLSLGLHARGWHPSAVFGVVAATMALASLRGFDEKRLADALGIAASMACGVVANFGTATKPLHIGRAVESAHHAVELAALGIDASADALCGRAGLLAALVGEAGVDRQAGLAAEFETTLLAERPGIKQYPVCYAAHRVIDAVLGMASEHDLSLTDVASVEATISTTTAGVLRQHRPATVAEARFSLEFVVAAALAHRRLGIREVSMATLADPRIQRFLPCVHTRTTDSRCPLEPSFAFTDEVTMTLTDGRTLASGPIRFALGHAHHPLDETQIVAKLAACARADEAGLAEALVERVGAVLA